MGPTAGALVHRGGDQPGRGQRESLARLLACQQPAELARPAKTVLVGARQGALVRSEALAQLVALEVVAPAGDGALGAGVVAGEGALVVLAVILRRPVALV